MHSRVTLQNSPMQEIIETCFLIETEHLPLAFTIIVEAQAEDSHLQQTLLLYPFEYKQRILQVQLIIYFNSRD